MPGILVCEMGGGCSGCPPSRAGRQTTAAADTGDGRSMRGYWSADVESTEGGRGLRWMPVFVEMARDPWRGGCPAKESGSEIDAHAQHIGPGAVVEVVAGAVATVEQELVFGPGLHEGGRQHIVFKAGFQAGRAGVLHAVAVNAAQGGAHEGTGRPLAEVVVDKAAGTAVPEIIRQILAFHVGVADALANTRQHSVRQVPAVVNRYAKTAAVEVLVAGAGSRKGKLPVARAGAHCARSSHLRLGQGISGQQG